LDVFKNNNIDSINQTINFLMYAHEDISQPSPNDPGGIVFQFRLPKRPLIQWLASSIYGWKHWKTIRNVLLAFR